MTNESTSANNRSTFWVRAVLVSVLAGAAAVAIGHWGTLVAGEEDNEASETVLLMPMARQLWAGPAGLYGPYNRFNLLVLIHAPLYYRLAALLARPLGAIVADPTLAALAAGRLLSFLGMILMLWMARRRPVAG